MLGGDVFNMRHGILHYRKMLVVFLSLCSKNCCELQSVLMMEDAMGLAIYYVIEKR